MSSYFKIDGKIKAQLYKKDNSNKGLKIFIRINKHDKEFVEFTISETELKILNKIIKWIK